MLRVKAELLVALPHARREEALAFLCEAITVARRQGAGLPRLRAASALARQLAETGDIEDAYAVLQPACESIRERSELVDVRTAHALLNDLTNR